jgi:hypothetical protein
MSQVTAGSVITLNIDGKSLTVKIEDASKSESILAKVECSSSDDYREGQVYEFKRSLLPV